MAISRQEAIFLNTQKTGNCEGQDLQTLDELNIPNKFIYMKTLDTAQTT